MPKSAYYQRLVVGNTQWTDQTVRFTSGLFCTIDLALCATILRVYLTGCTGAGTFAFAPKWSLACCAWAHGPSHIPTGSTVFLVC